MPKLTAQQIAEGAPHGWVYLLNSLRTRIATKDFATGLALAVKIGDAAEAAGHHPDLDLRYPYVEVHLTSHDVHAVTERDLALAHTITGLAADAGLAVSGTGLALLELALDTPSGSAALLPFWATVFGAEHRTGPDIGDEVSDPSGALPTIWFQDSGSDEPRQRWHPDVWIDPAEVRPRIDAAIAAGGTLVDDSNAPSFWVLADPEGNRMCLCTWQERG